MQQKSEEVAPMGDQHRGIVCGTTYKSQRPTVINSSPLYWILFNSSDKTFAMLVEACPTIVTETVYCTRKLAAVCDYCETLDGAGFNVRDTALGHSIARRGIKIVPEYCCNIRHIDNGKKPIEMPITELRAWIKRLYAYNTTQFRGLLLERIFDFG